jgi:hypothetical protein
MKHQRSRRMVTARKRAKSIQRTIGKFCGEVK